MNMTRRQFFSTLGIGGLLGSAGIRRREKPIEFEVEGLDPEYYGLGKDVNAIIDSKILIDENGTVFIKDKDGEIYYLGFCNNEGHYQDEFLPDYLFK